MYAEHLSNRAAILWCEEEERLTYLWHNASHIPLFVGICRWDFLKPWIAAMHLSYVYVYKCM